MYGFFKKYCFQLTIIIACNRKATSNEIDLNENL